MRLQRVIPWLAVLLVFQLTLVFLLWRGDAERPMQGSEQLLSFDRAMVDAIEISDGEQTMLLRREGGQWRLPGLFAFPAADYRVAGLLDDLAGLKPALAVATSTEAAKRFRVADQAYERRVRLLAGDTELASLYLGDAAGPRRAYGRAADDSAIYPLTFTALQLDASADGWSDKTLLHRDPATLAAVVLGDIRLERDGDGWRLADLTEAETGDADAAAALVERLANLSFAGVHGSATQRPEGEPLLQALVTLSDGTQVEYRFIDPGQRGDPLLWVSDRDYVLRIASFVFEPLQKASRSELLRKVETPPAPVEQASPADDEAVGKGGVQGGS